MSDQSVFIRLSEPELWAVIRSFTLTPTPVSPLHELVADAATLDEVVDAGRSSLVARKLADAERVNLALGSAVKVLCEPEELLSYAERGNIGTKFRRFYGRRELFVEHARSRSGEHAIAFPWTRGTIAALTARNLKLEVPS